MTPMFLLWTLIATTQVHLARRSTVALIPLSWSVVLWIMIAASKWAMP